MFLHFKFPKRIKKNEPIGYKKLNLALNIVRVDLWNFRACSVQWSKFWSLFIDMFKRLLIKVINWIWKNKKGKKLITCAPVTQMDWLLMFITISWSFLGIGKIHMRKISLTFMRRKMHGNKYLVCLENFISFVSKSDAKSTCSLYKAQSKLFFNLRTKRIGLWQDE